MRIFIHSKNEIYEENTVFNFEGGCYAKVINLTEENEPDIFRAIKKGAILENVVFKAGTNEVDFQDVSITQNTRVSYPIDHIEIMLSQPPLANIFDCLMQSRAPIQL